MAMLVRIIQEAIFNLPLKLLKICVMLESFTKLVTLNMKLSFKIEKSDFVIIKNSEFKLL